MFLLGLCLGAAVGRTESPAESGVRPNVLVVLSYHVGMEWEDSVLDGLRERLAEHADLVALQLDVKRFPQVGREEAMATNFASKAGMSRPAVVVAVDDYAYEFVRRHRAHLAPGTPVVFAGVNFLPGAPPPEVGGVVEAIDVLGTLRLAQALRPGARRLVVVNDATETGLANDAVLAMALAEIGERWAVLRLGRGAFAETEAALADLDPEADFVLLLSWNYDAVGGVRTYEQAVESARAVCPAPLFGVWSFYFGHGIVGGSLLDGYTHGLEAGDLALRAMERPGSGALPVVSRCRTERMVDAQELARFGISPSAVPPEVEVRFLEVPFWRRHLALLLTVGLVILLQAATIARLLWSRRRQKRAERELREREADLRYTLDSIGDAVIVTDAAGRIKRMNPVAERLVGCAGAAGRGRAFSEVVELRPVESGGTADPVRGALAAPEGAPAFCGRASIAGREREPRTVEYSMAAVRDEAGGLLGGVIALRDITAQQVIEAQLRQAQKMEALGRLVGGVAHDFNNLLLVIRGSLELAQQADTTADEAAEYLGEIDEAARRAADLTRQLLAFGRRQKLEMRTIDLAQLLDGLIKMIRRVITEAVEVERLGPAAGCWARVDPGQIEQVLLNLCVNARDAMPKGGRILLEVGSVCFTAEDAEATPWTRPGRFHVLAVSDNGVGMDEETRTRIFEPFYTTKPVGQGIGLGLSVVQGIVQQHDGFINVYSEPGLGTTFRVYLPEVMPVAQAEPRHGSGAEAIAADVGAGRTVLLAEDEPAVRRIASSVLHRHGFIVLEAGDGEEACAIAAMHTGPIDVAVLDVVMPRMGGPEAARTLQRARPALPILLCSGYPGVLPRDLHLAPDWQWLAKPYPVAELVRQVVALAAAPVGESGPSA